MSAQPRHILPAFGLPYAEAGVHKGMASSTCPVCGEVFVAAGGHKASAFAYAQHFEAAAASEAS